jgi:glutathione synthase/RimK-type ligase-like ATP-grasp enzyme
MDIGGNTPVEFLLDGSGVELITLYVVPGLPLPTTIPDHDVAMVVAPDDAKSRQALGEMNLLLECWPRPVLNLPQRILDLDRHKLCRKLSGIPGLEIPLTEIVSREWLAQDTEQPTRLTDSLSDGSFPLIVRPIGSHAGHGLRKLEAASEIGDYLEQRPEADFFISRFVDYSSTDGLFRKYRILLIDGRAYACHMAIDDQWKIWYLNADMLGNPANRGEEAAFMTLFDEEFATRHATALSMLADRLGLDYCTIDCAETKTGELLIFEADNTAIVHDMDPIETFPYKSPQMRKVFDAFVAMLYRRAGRNLATVA